MRISDWSSDVCSSDLLAGVFYLYYRPFLDEETGEFNGFPQGSAAVVAQVNDQSINAALFLKLSKRLFYVARCAVVIGVSGAQGVKITVKVSYADHSYTKSPAFVENFLDRQNVV